jgi:hypothetical protein
VLYNLSIDVYRYIEALFRHPFLASGLPGKNEAGGGQWLTCVTALSSRFFSTFWCDIRHPM